MTIQRRSSVPSRDTWHEAAKLVRAEVRPDDRVMWYPQWAGEARLALHHLPLIVPPHQGRLDVGRAKRLWVIGGFGYHGEQLIKGEHLEVIQPLKVIKTDRFSSHGKGEVTVTLLEVGGAAVQSDLLRDLSNSSLVEVIRSGDAHTSQQECTLWALNGWHCYPKHLSAQTKVERCLSKSRAHKLHHRSRRRDLYSLDRRRWLSYVDCGLHPTEHVSLDWRVIGGEPRRCIWFPPHKNKTVSLRWTPEDGHSNAELWFDYGWEDLAIRHPFRRSHAQDLNIEINAGNETLWKKRVSPRLGWHHERINLSAGIADGPPSPLVISLRATSSVDDAHLCIDLSLRTSLTL